VDDALGWRIAVLSWTDFHLLVELLNPPHPAYNFFTHMATSSAIDDLEFHDTPMSSSTQPPLQSQNTIAATPTPTNINTNTNTNTNTNYLSTTMSSSSHPSQIILHLLFKSLAILLYLFGSTLTSNFVFLFVVIILLQSADFYATKNIVGRKLAKLRWWATVDETTGKSNWRYESLDETDAKTSINTTDANFFWMVLYIYPLFWILFLGE